MGWRVGTAVRSPSLGHPQSWCLGGVGGEGGEGREGEGKGKREEGGREEKEMERERG